MRWGTALHERFLLPHFAMADLAEVVADLRAHDLDVDLAWFDPYLEFRFPRIGVTEVAGVELELRSAIEPWHVLGEELASGGTARYVDSSTERLQVEVRGFVPARHLLTVQRRRGAAAARPAPRAATWPASATGRGSPGRRCIRRWRSTPRWPST